MTDQQIDRALTSALRRAKGPAAADVDVRDCVDAERLAAWSAGALSEDDAAGVERHLATCARCQDVAAVFAETAEPVAAAALPATVQAPVSRILRRWMVPLAAAAAVVVWLAWPPSGPPAEPADTMARVQAPPPRDETPSSPSLGPTVAPPAPARSLPAPTTQGGAAATKLSQSARDAAAADQMKAVERSERSLLQNERSAEPKPTSAQRAQPSTLPPPPAVPAPPPAAPTTAPVPVSMPTTAPVLPPAAPAPVLAAPPPPPAATAPPPTAAREFRAPAMAEALDPRSVVAQFSSAMSPGVAGGAVAGAGRGGGGRGGGGGAANRQVMADATSVTTPVPHWRVLASGTVERSTDGGATWSVVLIDPPAHITSGAAPMPAICWLIGRGGVVLISTNGQPFVRVTPPTAADLASIRATNARDATVTTTDGRSFRTTDGGVTWVPV